MNEIGNSAREDSSRLEPGGAYRVLARKYRPRRFEDLIGQDAVVRTLTNAFAIGRIAHAYMLTGVRGVGKTTTARLIARALNYTGPGSTGVPSIDMPGTGEHCEAILDSRHPDVLEMDAASKTGIEDVRDIIEQVRYRPISARYKVYIIDEVHMLSKQAFNALLKTLEEPPEHVKFIFATTEIRKVPVTVLSRCQRFDLRRVDAALLIEHLKRVAAAEEVEVEPEALRMIARAAEGSVRDALSLLDQAIAYGGRTVKADDIQSMLGLSDRARVIDLFETVMAGDMPAALKEFEAQHALGSDPYSTLADLADFTHWVTRLKVLPDDAGDAARSEAERKRGAEFAAKLSMPALARAWQMLLKGLTEVGEAPNPAMAAEMLLVRMAYAAELPDPATLAREVQGGEKPPATVPIPPRRSSGSEPAPRSIAPASQVLAQPAAAQTAPKMEAPATDKKPAISDFRDIVALATEKRDLKFKTELERFVRPVSVLAGKLEIALEPGAPAGLPGELARKLEAWTAMRWMVLLSRAEGEKPLAQQARDLRDGLFREAREHPSVKAVLARFPGAEIVDVIDRRASIEGTAAPADETGEDRERQDT